MNVLYRALVVMVSVVVVSSAAAQVPITIDPGDYSLGEFRGSDRFQWNASPLIDDERDGLFGHDGNHRYGPQGAKVNPGTVRISISSIGSHPQIFVGDFDVDASGVITSDYEGTVFTIDGSTIRLITHEVLIDMGRYNGGWKIPSVNHHVRASHGPNGLFAYNLPVTTTGAYVVLTPGSTKDGLYKDAVFTVDASGQVTVTEPGAAGLEMKGGKLTFTNVFDVEYQWERSDGESFGVSWWAGGGEMAGGDDKGVSGTLGLVPGIYDIGWHSLPAGTWDNNDNAFEFTGNDDYWTKTLTYTANDGLIYTLALTYGTPPIPEPATMSLLALGGLAILRRRK